MHIDNAMLDDRATGSEIPVRYDKKAKLAVEALLFRPPSERARHVAPLRRGVAHDEVDGGPQVEHLDTNVFETISN